MFVHVATYNCNIALWSFGTLTELNVCIQPEALFLFSNCVIQPSLLLEAGDCMLKVGR